MSAVGHTVHSSATCKWYEVAGLAEEEDVDCLREYGRLWAVS